MYTIENEFKHIRKLNYSSNVGVCFNNTYIVICLFVNKDKHNNASKKYE